jgi:excisionase family DNA binding protein
MKPRPDLSRQPRERPSPLTDEPSAFESDMAFTQQQLEHVSQTVNRALRDGVRPPASMLEPPQTVEHHSIRRGMNRASDRDTQSPRAQRSRSERHRDRSSSTAPFGRNGTCPTLLICSEVAEILRTSPKAIYAMIERGQLPGCVVRVGRRVLIREQALLDLLSQKSASSSKE